MKSNIPQYQNNYLPLSKAQVDEIKEGLQHFHGTKMFYQIPLLKTRYTDGLK
ncbi:hypothetical protein [Gelidibacter salicanalis]|uniref:hypothetical protein n=1 Tax=Gelidibacter salicanalis TaxID=291193 RepID=UPI001F1B90E3|nr:hypothetical protein [Gelidibacter salicanalis]